MKTVIGGLTVEMEEYEDTEGSNCFVYKGKHSSSLALLNDLGGFEDEYLGEVVVKVPQSTIKQIEKWAYANGY